MPKFACCVAGGRIVLCLNRRTLLAALVAAAFGLAPIGCGNGRPAGVANQPGDNYIELSDLQVELVVDTELKMRVHYRFPDDLPHPDAWFQFYFEVNGGKSGATLIRKQGRELSEEGDIDASASAAFIRRKAVGVAVKVQQGKAKNGPWHDVSDIYVLE
jgi:hypothetical protein